MTRLPMLLAVCAAVAAPLQAQSDPRLLSAVRLAQEGLGDSARAVAGRVLAGTRPTDALYPEVLYTIAVVRAVVDAQHEYASKGRGGQGRESRRVPRHRERREPACDRGAGKAP